MPVRNTALGFAAPTAKERAREWQEAFDKAKEAKGN